MKKKLIRTTAMLLEVTMTLTSCADIGKMIPFIGSSDESEEKSEKDDNSGGFLDGILGIFNQQEEKSSEPKKSEVSVEDLVEVSDRSYTLNGVSGRYTGQWYQGHPEGNGRLDIDDTDYCDGDWIEGSPCGNVEIIETRADGSYMYYKGVYSDNRPAGEGYMYLGFSDNMGNAEIKGDFSDNSSLRWYSFDNNGFPVEFGIYSDEGVTINYIDAQNLEGGVEHREDVVSVYYFNGAGSVSPLRVTEEIAAQCDDNGRFFTTNGLYYLGTFYGPTDEDGKADGWGYYHGSPKWKNRIIGPDDYFYLEDIYNGEFGDDYEIKPINEIYDTSDWDICDVRVFGYWEHGQIVGKHCREYYLPETNTVVKRVTSEYSKDRLLTGDYTEISFSDTHHTYYGTDVQRNMNEENPCTSVVYLSGTEAFTRYSKNEDGNYTCPGAVSEEYFENGDVAYYWEYRYLQNPDKKNSWVVTGQYWRYNDNNELIEEGLYSDGLWMTYDLYNQRLQEEKERKTKEKLTLTILGAFAVGFLIWCYEDSKEFTRRVEARTQANNLAMKYDAQYYDLKRKAESEFELGNYSSAMEYAEQAKNVPIVYVPDTTSVLFGF